MISREFAKAQEEKIKEIDIDRERIRKLMIEARVAREAIEAEIKEVRKQFADLKERLSNAEMENQRLRGYIARVQEDDTVREELIATGDPDGEQQMVPKRKPTLFAQPHNYSNFEDQQNQFLYHNEKQPKPKHWVNY